MSAAWYNNMSQLRRGTHAARPTPSPAEKTVVVRRYDRTLILIKHLRYRDAHHGSVDRLVLAITHDLSAATLGRRRGPGTTNRDACRPERTWRRYRVSRLAIVARRVQPMVQPNGSGSCRQGSCRKNRGC